MDPVTLLAVARDHMDKPMPVDVRVAFLDAIDTTAPKLEPEDRLIVLLCAANVCTFAGQAMRGQELARRGTQLAQELDETGRALEFLNFTGICSSLLGNVVGAIDAFSHLQREASEIGDAHHHMLGALNLGYMFAYLGNADNAERVFDDARRISRLYGSARDEINAWVGLVQVHLDRHQTPSALEAIERARSLMAEHGDPDRRALDLLCLHEAWVDATSGAPDRALASATPLIGRDTLQLPQDALRVRYVLCHAAIAMGRNDVALEHANAGIGVGQQPLTESLMSHLMELRSSIHRANGDDDAAWADAHEAVRMARRSTFANVGAALRVSTEQYSNELRLREAELEVRNERLASVVADLKQANRRLALEVDEHKKTQEDLSRTHGLLVDAARMAGMAEVSTGVVHDIGNAVNSLLVSTHVLSEALTNESLTGRMRRASETLAERGADPAVCNYIDALADHANKGLQAHRKEVERMAAGVQHIAKIVQVQQRTAKSRGIAEPTDPALLVDDALQLALPTFDDSLKLDIHCPFGLSVTTARHRVVQILHNLIKNAHDALREQPDGEWRIRVDVDQPDPKTIRFAVEDSGPGIPEELRNSVFGHGFTTKRTGNGFGLHASALGAVELGGRLYLAPSESGRGARFELCLPVGGRQGAVNTRLQGTQQA